MNGCQLGKGRSPKQGDFQKTLSIRLRVLNNLILTLRSDHSVVDDGRRKRN